MTNSHRGYYLIVTDYNYGIADHNIAHGFGGSAGFIHCWQGNDTDFGDSAWESPTGFGGPNFFFVEDNDIGDPGQENTGGGADLTLGGKLVWRHNEQWGPSSIGNHDTGRSFDTGRGGRAVEIYNNLQHWTVGGQGMDGNNCGPGLYHDNRYDTAEPNGWGVGGYRTFANFGVPFYGASGAIEWDYNATRADGTHHDGEPGYVFDSGTISAVGMSGQYKTLTISGKNWTTNQWVGYVVQRMPAPGGNIAKIVANTSNILTIATSAAQTWLVGDTMQIGKPLRVLDGPTNGQGDHIDRNNPAWPNQAYEKSYSWNNVYVPNGHYINMHIVDAGLGMLTLGVDLMNDTPMPGYTPFTYPHPLTVD